VRHKNWSIFLVFQWGFVSSLVGALSLEKTTTNTTTFQSKNSRTDWREGQGQETQIRIF
jgi:hypothetical protein